MPKAAESLVISILVGQILKSKGVSYCLYKYKQEGKLDLYLLTCSFLAELRSNNILWKMIKDVSLN